MESNNENIAEQPKLLHNDSSFQSLHLSEADDQQENYTLPEIKRTPSKIAQKMKEAYISGRSKVTTLTTNLVYNLKNSKLQLISKRKKVVLDKQRKISLLGTVYHNKGQEKQKFYESYYNVIWLSYRHGICEIQSDAGWGCMIRVCQMVMAETFKRIFYQTGKLSLKQIIDYFKDTPESLLSLSRICEKGEIKGRWTSSIQIFSLLKDIVQELNVSFSKQKKMYPSIEVHSSSIQIPDLQKQLNNTKYPSLIFVSNRMGNKKIQSQYQAHMYQLMNIKYFVGAIGGQGGEALFLIGHYDDKIIFMDPHYVQSTDSAQINTSSYYQSEAYCIDVDKLAPSMAFNFLVKSKQEYEDLLKELYKLQVSHYPYICLQVNSPQLQSKIKARKESDDFQIWE